MQYENIIDKYKHMNKSAVKNGIVFFGTDWLFDIPIAEFSNDNGVEAAVHNRSIKGLKLKDAENVLDCCVCDLNPIKVFINIGENDIKSSVFDINAFQEQYEWLLYNIHSKSKAKIHILSIVDDKYVNANSILKQLSEKYGCEYIDIRDCKTSPWSLFSKIRFFLRCKPVSFCDVMAM